MDINAKRGTVVKFLNQNGYEYERHAAVENGLVQGQPYVVHKVDIGSWCSSVRLEGIDGRFNTVMFSQEGYDD